MKTQTVNIFTPHSVETHSPFDINKLSDKFRHRNTGWTIPEAFLGILFAAAGADGNIDQSESDVIMGIARRSRALQSLSPNDLSAANDVVNERFQNRPDSALKEACETLPADMCLPVFAHCMDIILADGELLKPEAEFLDEIRQLLDIESDNARRVMEVLLLKAQY